MNAADRRRLRRARMAALGLAPALGSADAPVSALAVTRSLGALQAQDYGSGVWSLGVRSGLTLEQVEQAVLDRQIVRTWPMRGTIHWVPAEDARWMCELLARRVLDSVGRRFAELDLTEADVRRSGEVLEEHLTTPVSRPDVVALLARHGIDPTGQRAYHLVGHHCMTGLLCQGPLIGRQPSFVLIDAWIPHSRKPARDEALATVAARYLRGHGPVTEKDLAGWVSGTLGFVREALDLLGDDVVREQVDGQTWLSHVDAPPARGRATGVHLLPQWDELLLGYKSRDVSLPDQHHHKVVPGRNMVFQPTVVVDGEVAGTWKRRQAKGRLTVDASLFDPATARVRRGLEAGTAAYGRFLGREAELTVTEA